MWERFTDRARKVMAFANEEAERFGDDCIGSEHIFVGLVKEGSGAGATILKNRGVDVEAMLVEIEQVAKLKGGLDPVAGGELRPRADAKKVIEYALDEARSLGHNYVGTEHVLLGLLRETEGIAAQVLMNLGVKLEDVRSSLG